MDVHSWRLIVQIDKSFRFQFGFVLLKNASISEGPVRPGRTSPTDTPRSRPVIGAFSSGFALVL
jgi:hypothetical protein